jgi:hypothetical protein
MSLGQHDARFGAGTERLRERCSGSGALTAGIAWWPPTQVTMLRSWPGVLEELAGLVNALASDHAGRAYLLQPGAGTIPVLQRMLLDSHAAAGGQQGCADGRLQQHALAALQKLSLHRAAQSEMLRAGLLEWAVGWLQVSCLGRAGCCCRPSLHTPASEGQQHCSRRSPSRPAPRIRLPACLEQGWEALSDFSLEFGSALLLNLALRSEGRARCGALAGPLLALCEALLQHPARQVRCYVNGLLYSALQRREALELAAARGLGHLLEAGEPAGAGLGRAGCCSVAIRVLLQSREAGRTDHYCQPAGACPAAHYWCRLAGDRAQWLSSRTS